MDIIKRIAAAYLLLHAAATALFAIIEPLYHDIEAAGKYSDVWLYLDPMTGVGIVIGIIFAAAGKFAGRADGERPLFSRLSVDAKFYGFLFVALLFYRNLFGDLTGSVPFPQAADVQWAIIYAVYPLLAGALAVSLWRKPRDG